MTCARPRLDAAPPHDGDAERVLLAGLLREPGLAGAACLDAGIGADDFYHFAHRLVWCAAWELVGSGCECSAAAVYAVLWHAGDLPELGAQPALWLAELLDADPTGAWCYDACGRVRRAAVRRSVIRAARERIRDAQDGVLSSDEYARQLG